MSYWWEAKEVPRCAVNSAKARRMTISSSSVHSRWKSGRRSPAPAGGAAEAEAGAAAGEEKTGVGWGSTGKSRSSESPLP